MSHCSPDPTPADDDLNALLDSLLNLRAKVVRQAEQRLRRFRDDYPDTGYTLSARNLAHYLAMRRVDLRALQCRLAFNGLSSLGRSESHVLTSLDRVISVLGCLTDRQVGDLDEGAGIGFFEGTATLADNAQRLFGTGLGGREVRIMVTLPSEAAVDATLVYELVRGGMDCARINCAHDGQEAWARMIQHVRKAQAAIGRDCVVLMDLAGHKLRTGELATKPAPVHIKPRRNLFGRVSEPALIELLPASLTELGTPGAGDRWRFRLPDDVLADAMAGDRLVFHDTRGKPRHFELSEPLPGGGWLATCRRGAYLSDTTRLVLERASEGNWESRPCGIRLGGFAREPVEIRLRQGDRLRLTRAALPGEPAARDEGGQELAPAHIACSTPAALDRLLPGQAVWIDDGKIGGVVEQIDAEGMVISITHCRPRGSRLRADKGLNFPGADLRLPSLSGQDLHDLDFVAEHADLVGYSFVETREDMKVLSEELARRNARHLGVIAKIETRRALQNLPDIILGTLGRHRLGIMIARGDLAVEIGGERLAEIQEEILWLCEAAHVPVIWATQVLETLTKTGVISRPELTDAAMAGRAECVMLNKGPHILAAVRTLDDILRRMQDHQRKKSAQLRALRLADLGQAVED